MGYDPVVGPNTYGSGCMPGCTRQFDWWRANYDAGTLGCYNPASLGGRSLHAEGRAMDIALNANDPAQRARGDAIVARVVANPDQFGAQEMLWRGGVWSYRRRGEGWRTNPPTQQADHMNHVHLGIDVNAARNWQPSWVPGVTPQPQGEDMPGFLCKSTDGTPEQKSAVFVVNPALGTKAWVSNAAALDFEKVMHSFGLYDDKLHDVTLATLQGLRSIEKNPPGF